MSMSEQSSDRSVLTHIPNLVAEEHALFERKSANAEGAQRLQAIQVELDQYWDLLRQRRALRETGHQANEAHKRPPDIVEKYIG
jgi:hypothetical protein